MTRTKTILLTGATGFVGSHLLRALVKNRCKVIIIKRSTSDTWRINEVIKRTEIYNLDKVNLIDIFKENKIDIIVHAATSYGRNGEETSDIIDVNLILPLKLLELAIKFKSETFLNTDTFFNTNMELPGNLKHYVLSKKQFIDYSKNICRNNNLRFVNLILFHVYGQKDDPSKFVPLVIGKMINNEGIDLTKGEQKRDFIYVEDVAKAYICIINNIKKMEFGYSSLNIGTGSVTSIKKMTIQIKELTHSTSILNFGALAYRRNEVMVSRAQITKLKNLGWKPSYNLKEGLTKTIEYYKNEKVKKL